MPASLTTYTTDLITRSWMKTFTQALNNHAIKRTKIRRENKVNTTHVLALESSSSWTQTNRFDLLGRSLNPMGGRTCHIFNLCKSVLGRRLQMHTMLYKHWSMTTAIAALSINCSPRSSLLQPPAMK